MLNVSVTAGPIIEPITFEQAKAQSRVDATFLLDDLLFGIYIPAARAMAEKRCRRAFFNQTWVRTLDNFPLAASFDHTVSAADRWNWPVYGGMWNKLTIDLPGGPVVRVVAVTYQSTDGTWVTVDPSLYNVDLTSVPCRLTPSNGLVWPWQGTYLPGSVQISYELASFVQAVTENFTAPIANPYAYTLLQSPQTAVQSLTQVIEGVVTPVVGWSASDGVLTLPAGVAGAELTVNYSVPNMPFDLIVALLMLVEHFYRNPGATTDLKLAEIPGGVEALLSPYEVTWTDYRPC